MSKGSWTHNACRSCFSNWTGKDPDQAARVVDDKNRCCFCGEHNEDGLYLREDPTLVHPVVGKGRIPR